MARRPTPRPTDEPTGLRIIAGEHRGRRLETPPGHLLRPMREQVRGALFNVLGAERVAGARVLDLFAGSGSLALEAVSRGAAAALCVDREPRCLEVLARNVAALRAGDRVTWRRHDLGRGLGALADAGPFDLVLLHPPFELLRRAPRPGEADVGALLRALAAGGAPARPGAVVAFETPRGCWAEGDVVEGLALERRRDYGSTTLFVAEVPGGGASTP